MTIIRLIIRIFKKIGILPKAARRYKHLYQVIDEIKPKNIMEIGTWNGKRAIAMIAAAQKHRAIEDVHYYGFDLFSDLSNDEYQHELSKKPPAKEIVSAAVSQTGARVHLYQGNTLKVLPQVVASLPKMDFVFIDGGHSLDTVKNDWRYTQEVMAENTVVIFDDYWANRKDGGCKPIVDKIDRAKYDVELLPTIDRFYNPDFGRLVIRFAKVTRKK